jgi:hypothetical protein
MEEKNKNVQTRSVVRQSKAKSIPSPQIESKMGIRLSEMLKEIELALCLTSNVATHEIEKIEGELESLLILTKQYKIKRLIREL